MCLDEGMAVHAFGILGGGQFKSPNTEDTGSRQVPPHLRVGREAAVSKVLDTVAKRHGVHITAVALAYAMQKVSRMCVVCNESQFFILNLCLRGLTNYLPSYLTSMPLNEKKIH